MKSREHYHPPMDLTKNEQIAALIKELETSDEPVIITPGYMLELFDDIGFESFLRTYGYESSSLKERTSKTIGTVPFDTVVTYIQISKQSVRLQDQINDEEL